MLFRSSLLSLIFGAMLFDEPDNTGGGGTEIEEANDEPVTMTQAELDRKIQVEKAKAKRSGRKEFEGEVAQMFGVSIEEAKKIIAERQQREESEKSEAQRAKEAADAEKAAAAKERAEATRERHHAKVERRLIKAGVDPDRAEDLRDLVKAEVGADDDAIIEAIDKVKEKFPSLFETAASNGGPRPVGGNPAGGGPRPSKPTAESARERAQARANARMPHKQAV